MEHDMTAARLFVAGVWRNGSSGQGADVVNPATACVVGRVTHATARDVDDAVHAARRALVEWRATSALERGAIFRRAATVLAARSEAAAHALTTEQGKTLAESRSELARAIETFSWHGDAAASTEMGPMAHARRLAAVERLADDARARGAQVLTGGRRLDRRGWFWPPTVLTGVSDDAALQTEEPFGPLAPIWSFATFDEGVARANANPYGLAAYVFTSSAETADRAARALDAGSVGVNELRGVPPDVGVAGVRDSGYGYEGGSAGIEAFLNLKVVRGCRHTGAR